MHKTFFVLILASLLLGGCAAAAVQSTPKTLPPTSTSWTEIVYTRSGGIAGRTTSWTLTPDGRLTDGSNEYKVTAQDANGLADTLVTAGIKDLSLQATETPSNCADCTTATVTLHTGASQYAFSAVLEDPSTTDKTRALFGQIDQFIQKAAKP